MHDTDSKRWRLGEHDEFAFLQNGYNVFHPVDRSEVSPDAKIFGARFVYRRKKDQNGEVNGHKVRLVARGLTQRPNVDFRETFAPVRMSTMRTSKEDLYMRVPEGIDGSEYAGKVLKLDRALYGLRQAGGVCNHWIHATHEGLGYRRAKSAACISICSEGGHTHYIALYVNDLLFVSPDLDKVQRIKDGLKRGYGVKGLGEAKFILGAGIQVHCRSNGQLFLSQPQLATCRRSGGDHQPTPAFRSRYLQAVGSLMNAMLGTRPDLCYAVGVLGRHAARPDSLHWAAGIGVLAYTKGMLNFGLEFQPDDSPLAGFKP
ncbi:hypothetical protein JCM3774_001222 [Rhodotorula dairenensis]